MKTTITYDKHKNYVEVNAEYQSKLAQAVAPILAEFASKVPDFHYHTFRIIGTFTTDSVEDTIKDATSVSIWSEL